MATIVARGRPEMTPDLIPPGPMIASMTRACSAGAGAMTPIQALANVAVQRPEATVPELAMSPIVWTWERFVLTKASVSSRRLTNGTRAAFRISPAQ